MNNPLPIVQLRNPPDPRHHDLSKYGGLSAASRALLIWSQSFTLQTQGVLSDLRQQVNTQVQGVGAALPSAGGTLTVSAANHHVTGTGTITTISPPSGFSGPLWLISDNGFSIAPGGNISTTGATIAPGSNISLTYDPTPAMWFVNSIGSALTAGKFKDSEVPAGAIDGTNKVFTLASVPVAGSVHLYRNGLRQSPTADYTIASSTITFVTAPGSGDSLLADYRIP